MIDLIINNPVLSVAVASILSAVLGYWWRVRAERRRGLAVSLYLLMEIWHRISIFQRTSFDSLFEQFESSLSERLPAAKLKPEELTAVKRYFNPILDALIRKSALEGFESLHEAYAEAVRLVAQQDPILAYRLDSASNIKRRLEFFDSYLAQAISPLESAGEVSPELSAIMQRKLREFAGKDTASDLEALIKSLALKYGVLAYAKVVLIVRGRKNKLQSGFEESIEKMIDDVIVPMLFETQQGAAPDA